MNKKRTSNYINRELSWLEFNQRVLDEAKDDSIPLLERLKFLAITGSNLDEFFMVRVGGLQMLSRRRRQKSDPAGMTNRQQLRAIASRTRDMSREQYQCLNDIETGLARHGIHRLKPGQLSENQLKAAEQTFADEIAPILTPQALSTADEFPLLANRALHVLVRLQGTDAEPLRLAVVPCSQSVPRFLTLRSEGGYAYMLVEDMLSMFVDRFFFGERVEECAAFRIIRNADISLREDQASDLMADMEEMLDARKESHCVRLEISDQASKTTLDFLRQALGIGDGETCLLSGPPDLSAFMHLTDLPGSHHLKYEDWPSQPSPNIDLSASLFEQLARGGDVLLYHPYESFEPVVRLIEEAADDPDVLAIKQTLYRTSRNSPIVAALARAAENGKYVTAVVELKARFDEARNIEWAKALEQSQVQVIYGVKGLKTHAKVCIIVRREPHGIQRYMHFGTGNYNESTAKLYSDVSFMTNDDQLGADATNFFNAITGFSQPQMFNKIEAAPIGLREKLIEMIESETQRKRQGQKAHIVAKLNSLVDTRIIDALYAASQAGVQIRLNVRGICCLRPGIEGVSENITVISIIDRYLEHARIFYFHHGGDERVFISSADWMPRNLDRRVELLIPIEDKSCRRRLIAILDCYFRDNVKARRLRSDGGYEPVDAGKRKRIRSQYELYQLAVEAVKELRQSRRTVFEPYQAPGTGS